MLLGHSLINPNFIFTRGSVRKEKGGWLLWPQEKVTHNPNRTVQSKPTVGYQNSSSSRGHIRKKIHSGGISVIARITKKT